MYFHNGCKQDNPDVLKKDTPDEDNELAEAEQITVYNNIRECVYEMYLNEKRLLLFSKGGEPEEVKKEKITADMLKIMSILQHDE